MTIGRSLASLDVVDGRRTDGNGGGSDRSVWLARLFTLPDEIQRSLACVRSLRHLLWQRASRSADSLSGGAVCGGHRCVWHGDWRRVFLRLSIREGMAKGAGFGAALMVPGLRGRMNWVNKKA